MQKLDFILTTSDVKHLLKRVGLAGRSEEISFFTGKGLYETLNYILDSFVDPAPVPDFNPNEISSWPKAQAWWVNRIANASWVDKSKPNPLSEKMTLFWHSHFACGVLKPFDMKIMWDQHLIFRQYGLKNFSDLLLHTSKSSAMLRYIDNYLNVKQSPQENFARELMELHTLGVGNFTEQDVVNMAKLWSGHNTVGWNGSTIDNSYKYYPERHHPGPYTLFGEVYDSSFSIENCIDLLAAKKETAFFITKKLFKLFITDDPNPADVEYIASKFNGDISNLLFLIFTSEQFWATSDNLVRSPVEWAAYLSRQFNTPAIGNSWVSLWLPLGQQLFEPPNVSGWGTNDYWISTSRSWGKAFFVSSVYWGIQFPEIATSTTPHLDIANKMDIEINPSNQASIIQWHNEAKSTPWLMNQEAILLAAMLPEIQVY